MVIKSQIVNLKTFINLNLLLHCWCYSVAGMAVLWHRPGLNSISKEKFELNMLHFLILLQLTSLNIQHGRADTFLLQTKGGKQFIATSKNSSNSVLNAKIGGLNRADFQNEWVNECSLDEGNGAMVQYDIPNGGSIHMKCTGGCLNIIKVL